MSVWERLAQTAVTNSLSLGRTFFVSCFFRARSAVPGVACAAARNGRKFIFLWNRGLRLALPNTHGVPTRRIPCSTQSIRTTQRLAMAMEFNRRMRRIILLSVSALAHATRALRVPTPDGYHYLSASLSDVNVAKDEILLSLFAEIVDGPRLEWCDLQFLPVHRVPGRIFNKRLLSAELCVTTISCCGLSCCTHHRSYMHLSCC